MNNSIIKAKEKADKEHHIRNWWRKNDYKVIRIILFPLWIASILNEKYKNESYKKMNFTTALCKQYLDKVIPEMVAHYCEKAETFLISDADEMGDIEFNNFWNFRKQNKKIKRFFLKFNNEFKEYILNQYEIDGYSKFVLTNWTHWEQARERFDWRGTPYNSDYRKGVVFYIENT